MRFAHSVVAVCVLLLAIPSWGKQPRQSSSPTQPTSDPQAVAVVQTAITALGGATAIGQAQSWTFQGVASGTGENGSVSYMLSVADAKGETVVTMKPGGHTLPWLVLRSHFVSILVGSILLHEVRDTSLSLSYLASSEGTASLSIVSVTVPTPSGNDLPAQVWTFDNATGLPLRAVLKLPVQVGNTQSFTGIVEFSQYESVSNVLYPFQISTSIPQHGTETITVQSLTPSTTATPSNSNPMAGGVQ